MTTRRAVYTLRLPHTWVLDRLRHDLRTGADPAGTPGPLGPVHLTGSYVPGPSGALPAGERRAPATGLEGEGP